MFVFATTTMFAGAADVVELEAAEEELVQTRAGGISCYKWHNGICWVIGWEGIPVGVFGTLYINGSTFNVTTHGTQNYPGASSSPPTVYLLVGGAKYTA